ncbi:transient receptor potential cation channel subfamily A member 1, partial [Biomphalaria glabrata]
MSNSFDKKVLRKQDALHESSGATFYNNRASLGYTSSECCAIGNERPFKTLDDSISIISNKTEPSPKLPLKKNAKSPSNFRAHNVRTLSDVTENLTKLHGKQCLETMSMLEGSTTPKIPVKKNMSFVNKLRAITKMRSFSQSKGETVDDSPPVVDHDVGLVCLIEDSPMRILK